MNDLYYAKLLRQLRKSIQSKHPGKLMKTVLFLQDNTPAYISFNNCCARLVWNWLITLPILLIKYYLFPQLTNQYRNNADIISAIDAVFDQQDQQST